MLGFAAGRRQLSFCADLQCLEAVYVHLECLKVSKLQQARAAAAGGHISSCATYLQGNLAAGMLAILAVLGGC